MGVNVTQASTCKSQEGTVQWFTDNKRYCLKRDEWAPSWSYALHCACWSDALLRSETERKHTAQLSKPIQGKRSLSDPCLSAQSQLKHYNLWIQTKTTLQPLERISEKSLLHTTTVWSGQPNISYGRSVLENRKKTLTNYLRHCVFSVYI